MADEREKKDPGVGSLKHDIRNQLSNITLCVEQLKFELPEQNEDITFYIETIAAGCKKINELLKSTD
ncbi:hypothetical protein [Mucilaginibacter polytrichastri]|uniref:Signal transduction histidine kinase dimerisation/phosphoacceptor domain-containing protein n=1 Tax=Mucilaginibacter polytrichastri TaxID=1302689 RepID=A0A1Q6A4W8_9SPHI|nr:hypothetical protein [Mucilaginibacter polytrichastri]OKS89048.1 hypothetical protein RG47T_4528 [Mucilaginibacter polytrichastri]SFS95807.1 hypothetical protein SAMN04487890_10790 [Mucilaginibacter polytrichastri]